MWKILKLKKVYIPALIVILFGLWYWRSYSQARQPTRYDTVKVNRGNLLQTVEGTGKIESVNGISLRFDIPGMITKINVKVGDTVKAGTVLATLRTADLDAAVAQAAANLNQKLAGATDEDKLYYQAAMNSALASYEQSKIDATNDVNTAQAALDTAKNDLKLIEGGENSQIVNQAYEDMVAVLQTSLSKLDDALTQADNILGVDNIFGNDSFESSLSLLDSNKLGIAKMNYGLAKNEITQARLAANGLNSGSIHADVDTAVPIVESAISKAIKMLAAVSDVLRATPPTGDLSQTSLDAKKTVIEAARVTINTQYTNLINQKQSLADAKNSLSSYQIAYNKAVSDLAAAQADAQNSVKIKEASYNQAVANYQSKIKAPRAVDLASYRAALAQAEANRDKAVIKAPIAGVIGNVNYKVGETISSANDIITLVSPHFEARVDIPETDVAKIQLDDAVFVTLDAFGGDVKFNGKITAIDPASTEVQDVVYYKVKISLDDTDKAVKSGMTANVSIDTDKRENVLNIPLRSVRARADGSRYARVLADGKEQEITVKLGLKANDNRVEILEGLTEGQDVILGIKQN